MDTPLSSAQVDAYERDGFLLVSGLVPAETAARAAQALVRLQAENGSFYFGVKDPAILACYNERVRAAAAQLKRGTFEEYGPRTGALAIINPPESGDWEWPRPHIDGALKEDDKTVEPPPFRIATMLYLSDIETRGGATVVWPGSPRRLAAAYRADPVRFHKAYDLNHALHAMDLGDPVELTAGAGDILFYAFLCAHAGSRNVRAQPRLALNQKW